MAQRAVQRSLDGSAWESCAIGDLLVRHPREICHVDDAAFPHRQVHEHASHIDVLIEWRWLVLLARNLHLLNARVKCARPARSGTQCIESSAASRCHHPRHHRASLSIVLIQMPVTTHQHVLSDLLRLLAVSQHCHCMSVDSRRDEIVETREQLLTSSVTSASLHLAHDRGQLPGSLLIW
jgi:hypothetical protein